MTTEALKEAEKLCAKAVKRKRAWRLTRADLQKLKLGDLHFGASSGNASALRIVREALRSERQP